MMEQNDDGICKALNLVHFKIEKLHNIPLKKERIRTQPRLKRQESGAGKRGWVRLLMVGNGGF